MSLTNLLAEIEERHLAQRIGIRHDEQRMRYPFSSNTVRNFDEFSRIIGEYYNYHVSHCVTRGGRMTRSKAESRAKALVESEYRRRGGDIVMAYNDARDGTNGGLRAILDIIADGLKAESVEDYIRDVFDRYVAPNSWSQKVNIIQQFMRYCGAFLSSSIHTDQPERYAQNYQELISSYVDAIKTTSSIFRRF
jgi:hypothetical protein